MRKTGFITTLLTALLTGWLATSCDYRSLEYEGGTLELRLQIPDAVLTKALTKAETGEVAATTAERTLTTLQIWIFKNGDASLIEYLTLNAEQLAATGLGNGMEVRLAIPLTDALYEERPNVDVYALANGASTGLSFDGTTSRVDLQAAVLSGNVFGTTTLTTAVPAAGLPMSGVLTNAPMSGDYPVLSVPTVTLTRAVSKLRFVFCALAENGQAVDDFAITRIDLNGRIGAQERLFTQQTYASHTYGTKLFELVGNDNYSPLAKSWPTDGALPSTIALNESPGDYLWQAGMTAQQYETRIENGVRTGVLSEWGLTYLRETDQKLSGTIEFTIGTGANLRTKTATFEMDSKWDFTRNHSWIIFGYFIGGRLVVQPFVCPWIAAHNTYNYSTEGSTEMDYETYLRFDEDHLPYTWDDTYVSVAYGYLNNESSGRPTRSPLITLRTTNTNTLRVQVTNDRFKLVQRLGDDTYSYVDAGQSITIAGSTDEQQTSLYVVPVDNSTFTDPFAKLVLTEVHNDGRPPENIPYNHNLPGDEDHTSILIYNCGANYSTYYGTSKVGNGYQTGQYWMEE